MSGQVYDYRTDVCNMLVTPWIRSRFLRMEPGESASLHSHDLGHEIFLVLAGRAEFTIDGGVGEVGPGQLCVALADEIHSVRTVGDEPMTMYLSVTPHIQPTHTGRTADGDRMPTRFAPSRSYDVEAVLLCHSDPKTDAVLAALDAGKHVLIEKPVCYSLREAEAIAGAAGRAGVVAQAGYMKVYDPAFETAKAEVDEMKDIRFVQVNHLHPDNRLHLRQFRLKRFDDLPPGPVAEANAARKAAVLEAIGEASDDAVRAFHTLSGSMIHDLYCLRAMLGMPESVVSTEVWNEGRAISTVLSYRNGARCVASWVDLPELWEFRETLEVYGGDRRVLVSYPTGFARGILSTVVLHEINEAGETSTRRPAVAWESPFVRELRHFHACITGREACRTPAADAREDVRLIIDITRAYMERGP